MPEGHSLRITAERLRPLVGQPVTGGLLAGAAVTDVEARGKHMLVHGDDGRVLHVHFGMHGFAWLGPPGTGRGRHVVATPAGDAVFSRARVAVERASRLRLALGPDLLGRFDAREYLRRARLVDRPVGEMLLDQRVLAGIGNVVKSEALWQLRVDPFAPVSALGDRRLLELAAVARRDLRAGVAARGPLPKRVYRRAGRACPRCGAPIRGDAQGIAARRTYWCPACQGGRT
jgi:endonuclease VIII